jgi:nicotinate-nucleotide adenylyltransferase
LSSPSRVGLFGGTFDPIHQGHLHLIAQLFARNIIDELIVVPAGQPWLRKSAPIASAQDRLAMAELGVKDLPVNLRSRVWVSDVEVRRSGPTYTIDTVKELKASRPDAQWHRNAELRSLIKILEIARGGEGFNIDALPVSASEIRSQIQAGQTQIKYLPESVWAYIEERNLYVSN